MAVSPTEHVGPDVRLSYIFQDELVTRDFLLPSSYLRVVEFALIQVGKGPMIREDDEWTAAEEIIVFGDSSFYSVHLAFSRRPVAICRAKGV